MRRSRSRPAGVHGLSRGVEGSLPADLPGATSSEVIDALLLVVRFWRLASQDQPDSYL